MIEDEKETLSCNGCEYNKGGICTNIQSKLWGGRVDNMRACGEYLPQGLTEYEARRTNYYE